MTSLPNNNRCKLLLLDIDTDRLNTNDLRTFFTPYGPIEWIEIFPKFSSAIIYFVSYLIVDRLVSYRTCLIDQKHVRLRRFRLDKINSNIDCHILRVKQTNVKLTESLLYHCFEKYQSYIQKINIYPNNQALIYFSDYDYIDQILLLPSNSFQINNKSLVLEREIQRKSCQWKQQSLLLMRDPVINQLLHQIEYLSKQFQEQSGNSRHEIQRLEAELFILKNENAQLKSKQKPNQTVEQRLTALEDISNRLVFRNNHYKRSTNNNNERQLKRLQ